MRTQSMLYAAATLLATTISAAPTPDSTAAKAPLAMAGFGVDPLEITRVEGSPTITAVLSDSANAHSGVGYLSVAFPASTEAHRDVVLAYGLTFASNKEYTVSVWAKGAAADNNCYMTTGFQDNSGNLTGVNAEPIGTAYKEYSSTINSGKQKKGNGIAYFYVSCTGTAAETLYIDDFSLV